MDILEFTRVVESGTDRAGLARWARSTRSTLVESVLHLGHYIDEMPDEVRLEYERLLVQVVSTLPEGAPLSISIPLQRRLLKIAPSDIAPLLERSVSAEEVDVPS